MELISYKFAFIVIISVLIFYHVNYKYRTLYLTAISCGFIATFSYVLLLYVLIYALVNYILGLKIPGSRGKVLLFRIGITLNLLQLILLKYSSFVFDPVFSLFNSDIRLSGLSDFIIPVGISYFTLQGIGYLINIKMGWEKSERNFFNFLLYCTFYPKFLSGPIERSNHFLPQIREHRVFNEYQVSEGLRVVLIGVFKKVVIANPLAIYTISTYSYLNEAGGSIAWLIFIIQPLYLYFDFSGYTDMAIGIAKMFGIELLPNFQRPFFAENVASFWKRFHMSLSSWFNDYIFRQISFRHRRWGIWASTYALFLTWVLFGIWHGAGWTFMFIGFLQAIAINYEFFTKKIRLNLFSKISPLLRIWFGRTVTYLFYCFSLVFFFAPDIRSAGIFISKLATIGGPTPFSDMSTKPFQVLVYIPLFLALDLLKNDYTGAYSKIEKYWSSDQPSSRMVRWAVYSSMITIIYIAGFKSQQFIYANF